MSLVYSLFEKGIGTCILNGSFTEYQEKELSKEILIPENEMLSSLILLSKIKRDETVLVAKSCHRKTDTLVTMIE